MIRKLIPSALALGLTVVSYAQAPAGDAAPPVGEEAADAPADIAAVKADSSYALGFQSAQQLRQYGLVESDVDTQMFLKGFLTSLQGQDTEIPEAQLQAALQALGTLLQDREDKAAAANLEAGREFLAENAKREGVTTTASGLQYEIIEKGGNETYVAPKAGEPDNKQFLVNYRGTLIDGKQFDASEPGKPLPMTLEVIDGFKEALTMMPVGAKWKLFIPSELAYGDQRRGPDIAPNSVLIFELELTKIEDAPPAPHGLPFAIPGGE
jgi:FKBP-type peptidyl-prolyl cis-trans isomerase